MKKNIIILIGLVVIILGVSLLFFYQNNTSKQEPEDSMMKKDDVVMNEGENKTGQYISYDQKALSDKKNVIFFAASWCPTCRVLDGNIKSNIKSIPDDLTILKVDYDNSSDLKRKYGVTYQHTLVQVDQDGNMLKKWSGSEDIQAIVNQLL